MSATTLAEEGAAKPQGRPLRRIPIWGWVLGAIFFPAGIFIVLGAARALRWWAATALAIGSYAMLILFGEGVHVTESMANYPSLSQSAANMFVLLGMAFYCGSVGQLQYAVGRRHGLWTEQGRRIWWIFAFLLFFMLAVCVGGLGVCLLIMRMGGV